MSTQTVASSGIISKATDHIRSRGGSYGDWYAGVTASPKQRLFVDHNVDQANGKWAYWDCGTDTVARDAEAYFLNQGCKGGGGGGDSTARFFYIYKITQSTNP